MMESESERVWWEKTVEYKFLLDFCRDKNLIAYPLAGKEEEAGDGFFSINKASWGLFEFKRSVRELDSEIEKFAVKHHLLKSLDALLPVDKKATAAQLNVDRATLESYADQIDGGRGELLKASLAFARPLDKLELREHQALHIQVLSASQPSGHGAEMLQNQAKALISRLRLNAFERAKAYLFERNDLQQSHWIVYGDKDEQSAGIKLYRTPYFELTSNPPPAVLASGFNLGSYANWNGTEFITYVRQFINFKLYGEALPDEDKDNNGGRRWPDGVGQQHPSYIVGVDGDNVLWAPLDGSHDTRQLLKDISRPSQKPTVTGKPTRSS